MRIPEEMNIPLEQREALEESEREITEIERAQRRAKQFHNTVCIHRREHKAMWQ